MFGCCKKNKEPERPPIRKEEFTSESVELSAQASAPSIIAEQSDKLTEFLTAHKKDSAEFSFSCKRNGDFISLDATRGSKLIDSVINNKVIKNTESQLINLSKVKNIELDIGQPANMEGTVYFEWYSYSHPLKKEEAVPIVLRKNYPLFWSSEPYSENRSLPTWRSFTDDEMHIIDTIIPESPNKGGSRKRDMVGITLNFNIPNCAQPAVDDELHFVGSNVHLLVPFGCGKQVREKIIKAIGYSIKK